ncbi:hypothetical protein [Companilactobacillus farciminis]|uniref:hypothetical protein n=1 Tax=Companilactobacillus farciminis TaxID=1612 RepID=UPI00232B6D4E|nr:hypothetical protein [Companilactobacillus farciminis]WCG35070.1 hypothetical protein PML84_09585 [Companilactobacillus farciminis]
MEKSFARKLNWKPLLNSLIFGAAIGSFVYIIFRHDLTAGIIWDLIGFFIQSMVIYPRYLPSLYGQWKITEGNVSYYDYSTWTKRIKAIFLPLAKKQKAISFDDILSYSLVVTKKSNKWTPHYIILKVDDGHDVALDLSWNLLKSGAPQKDVEWVVDFITNKLNQKTVKVLQA